MRMIGAWLVGTTESIQFAVDTHLLLVDHIISQLCQVTSRDRFQQSLPTWICDAALLNIIFSLYYGREHEVSRAITLCNLLMGVLRDVCLFTPDTSWADDKMGYFEPLRDVKAGQRERMAYTLFKLNAYISIPRNHPMTILSEELHFRPPCTFALWNADGLHIWEERRKMEAMSRFSRSMHRMIVDYASETDLAHVGPPMLIEDIHLCLCAMQSDVWRLNNSGSSTGCRVNDVLQRDALKKRLEYLNSRLERIIAQPSPVSSLKFGHEHILPYRYYYGYEDHSRPGWQEVVSARVKAILFDTVMLYFLLNLHVTIDVRNLTLIAKDQDLTTVEEISEVHRRAREQRQAGIKGWTSTPAARSALCQATEIFVAYQTYKNGSGNSNARDLDPICHVALCISALIVWVFCKFYDHGCEMCLPGTMQTVELTAWSLPGKHLEKEKAEWIEAGDQSSRLRPQLQGIQLCHCNIDFVVALFQTCLPAGWEIADSIAPGIFKNMT